MKIEYKPCRNEIIHSPKKCSTIRRKLRKSIQPSPNNIKIPNKIIPLDFGDQFSTLPVEIVEKIFEYSDDRYPNLSKANKSFYLLSAKKQRLVMINFFKERTYTSALEYMSFLSEHCLKFCIRIMNVSLEYSEHILPIHIEILKNFLIQINRKNIPVELYGRKAGELFRKVKDYGPFCYTEFDLLSYKNSIRFLEKHPDYCKSLGFRISWSPDVNEFKNLLFKNKKLIEQIYTLYIGIHLESLSNIYNALPDFTKLRHLVIKNLHFDLDLTLLNLRELLISAGKKGIKITIPSMTNLRYLVINPSSQSVITIAPQVNLQNLSIRYSKFIKFQLKISPKISPFILNSLFELMVYDNDSSFQDPLFPALKKIKTSETTTQFSHNKVTVLFNNEETMPKAFSNKLLKKGAKSLNQFNNFINKNIIYPFNALAFCPTTRAQPNEPETQKVTPDTNK